MDISQNNPYGYSDPSYNNNAQNQPSNPSYGMNQGNTNQFHHSSDASEMGSKENEKRLNYLVSLRKKHLYLGSIFVILMFFIFFFMGLFFGYQYSDQKIARIIQENNSLSKLESEQAHTAVAEVGGTLNQESKLIFDQNISSDVLLKKDLANQEVSITPTTSASSGSTGVAEITKNSVATPNQVNSLGTGSRYYYIQVVATSFEDKARNIYYDFKERNYPVKVKKSEKEGKTIYQIRLGLYQDRQRALRHLRLTRNLAGYKEASLVALSSKK